jgi:uncharacterized protein YwgA
MSLVSVDDAVRGVIAHKGAHRIGRTRIMKCLYFLQAVGGMDVDLHFDLYTWGPFDQQVLESLKQQTQRGLIKETIPGTGLKKSYDYDLTVDDVAANSALTTDQQKLQVMLLDNYKADALEALSTLHFASAHLDSTDGELLVARVKNIKPYFRLEELRQYWQELVRYGWVKSGAA